MTQLEQLPKEYLIDHKNELLESKIKIFIEKSDMLEYILDKIQKQKEIDKYDLLQTDKNIDALRFYLTEIQYLINVGINNKGD